MNDNITLHSLLYDRSWGMKTSSVSWQKARTAGIDSGSGQLYVPAALPPAPKDDGPCIRTYVLDRHNTLAGLLLIIIRKRVVKSRTVCSNPTCLQLDSIYYNTLLGRGGGVNLSRDARSLHFSSAVPVLKHK